MKLLFVGYGRCGKDTAGEYLDQVSSLRFAGTTSKYLTKYVAAEMGVSEEFAYLHRHENRDTWKRIGDEIRDGDPGKLIREALEHGEITGGVRDIAEVQYAKDSGIVDAIIWIENTNKPVDPTVTFSPREADFVVQNNWGLPEFHRRLWRLAVILGIDLTPVIESLRCTH